MSDIAIKIIKVDPTVQITLPARPLTLDEARDLVSNLQAELARLES